MSNDDANWHTGEVHLMLANDEPWYRAAVACGTPDELRETFEYEPTIGVDWAEVDWQQVFDWFEEDRA